MARLDAKFNKVTNNGRGWHVPSNVYPGMYDPDANLPEETFKEGPMEEWEKNALKEIGKSWGLPEEPAYTAQYINKPEESVVYECETDKPEGTRDVDKFLKEQQDKLWRGE